MRLVDSQKEKYLIKTFMKTNDQEELPIICKFVYYNENLPDKKKSTSITVFGNPNNPKWLKEIEDILFYSQPPLAAEHIYGIEGHLLFKYLPDSLETTIVYPDQLV
jgi:hypothetical protein